MKEQKDYKGALKTQCVRPWKEYPIWPGKWAVEIVKEICFTAVIITLLFLCCR